MSRPGGIDMDMNGQASKLMWDGMEVAETWERKTYVVDGHTVIYIPGMGWAWDMATGNDGPVRWNKRRAKEIGDHEETILQIGRAVANMNR